MDVKLPDGTIVKGVPDGTTKLELFHRLREANHPAANSLVKDIVKDYNEPDVGGLAWRAGAAVNDIANKVLPDKGAAGLGYLTNVGIQAVPALLGANGAQSEGAPLLKGAGEWVMKKAVKPSVEDVISGDAAKAITTMLENGYNATAGGVAKMRAEIANISQMVSTAIQNSPALISRKPILEGVQNVLNKFRYGLDANDDIAKVKAVWDNFRNHPELLKIADKEKELGRL